MSDILPSTERAATELIDQITQLAREHAPAHLRRLDDWTQVDLSGEHGRLWRISYGTRRERGGAPGASVQLLEGGRELMRVDIDLTELYA